jgi:hypothetical protein
MKMMKLARLVLMLFLVAGWAAAQCGAPATAAPDKANDKGKKDSAAAAEHKDGEHKEMSCGCCKNMGKKDADAKDGMKAGTKDASKAGDKDAAKSEAKSEGGMMAGGMDCCAKMGKDKDASGGGMKCGGGKKDDGSKSGTLPEQKMK